MEWFEMNDVETMLRLGGTLRAASREMFKPLDREFFLTDSLSEKRLYALLGSLMAPRPGKHGYIPASGPKD